MPAKLSIRGTLRCKQHHRNHNIVVKHNITNPECHKYLLVFCSPLHKRETCNLHIRGIMQDKALRKNKSISSAKIDF